MQVHREDPLILIELGASSDPDDPDAFDRPSTILAAAITQPSFAIILRVPASRGPRTPDAVRQRWRTWLDAHAARFASSCEAVAVIAPTQLRALPFRLASPLLRRMFHAPARTFLDEPAARAWIAARLVRSPVSF